MKEVYKKDSFKVENTEKGWQVSVLVISGDFNSGAVPSSVYLHDENGEIIYFPTEEEAKIKGIPELEKKLTQGK